MFYHVNRSFSWRGLGVLHRVLSLPPRIFASRRWDIRVGSCCKRALSSSVACAEMFKDHELHHPVVTNTRVDGRNAYATSDLLEPHPTKPGLWKIFGRKDDQIMLSTGEKTNPGPL